jgi:hypothetical protein
MKGRFEPRGAIGKPSFRKLDLYTFSKDSQVRTTAWETANRLQTDAIHSKLFDCARDRSGESRAPRYGREV